MTYRYDVFISYRRHPAWIPWTREYLKDLLDAYLTPELGRDANIFIDEQIDAGVDWPDRIGSALGTSRILLPVFTKDYFSSAWCLHELDLMHQRLHQYAGCTLIVPTIGQDGDSIPDEIGRIQALVLKDFRNTDLQRRTPRFELFADAVHKLAISAAQAIASAPLFDPMWEIECKKRFREVYDADKKQQRLPVTSFTIKPAVQPISPPRVNP